MQRFLFLPLTLGATLLLGGCGMNQALILNNNQISTQVQLAQGNYRYVGKATGTDSVSYVLVFGGMNKKSLYARAYASMVEKADLSTGSRALVNVVTEEHIGGVIPLFYTRTVTVSGQVIEFTR